MKKKTGHSEMIIKRSSWKRPKAYTGRMKSLGGSEIVLTLNMLTSLTYASLMTQPGAAKIFDGIVEHACVANVRLDVTGVISFDGERIVQILEGPREVISALFDRICADGRHSGVVELSRELIEERAFSGWSMTLRPASDLVMMAWAHQGHEKRSAIVDTR